MGLWAGAAQAMRLEGPPTKVILAVAQHSSQGLPVLSGVDAGQVEKFRRSDARDPGLVKKGYHRASGPPSISHNREHAGATGGSTGGHRRTRR